MKATVEIEVGVGLEKDHFWEMLMIKGMTEVQAITADPGLVQELTQIEIELGLASVESTVILPKTAPPLKKKEN